MFALGSSPSTWSECTSSHGAVGANSDSHARALVQCGQVLDQPNQRSTTGAPVAST